MPILFNHCRGKAFIISEQGTRGSCHSHIFLSPCLFTFIVDKKYEQLSDSICIGLSQ
jgi:hypothetical protein